ncbi:MAG: crossover junction endodeoxyribonuclease RuvC [Bacteroidetes bacterium]|nr:crossover junction endodeoxyribonuclease RuvC [Bacteroidota bacterium]
MNRETAVPAKVILGIDPGTLFMGFALIAASKNKLSLLEMGVLRLARHNDHSERLRLIYVTIQDLIQRHRPVVAAIEAPFFGKNVQSMLKLGRAQGVAIAAATVNGLTAVEYAPNKVKQSITGRGHASKEQVWEMLRQSLQLREERPEHYDATDALAVAVCHHYQGKLAAALSDGSVQTPKQRVKKGNWAQFIAQNPDRLR